MGRKKRLCIRPGCPTPADCTQHCKCDGGAQCAGHRGSEYCPNGLPASTRRQALCSACQKAREVRKLMRQEIEWQSAAKHRRVDSLSASDSLSHSDCNETVTGNVVLTAGMMQVVVPSIDEPAQPLDNAEQPTQPPSNAERPTQPPSNAELRDSETTNQMLECFNFEQFIEEDFEFFQQVLAESTPVPTVPTSDSQAFACRFTTFALKSDSEGGYRAAAAGLDAVFTSQILANAHSVDGYVDCVRLLDEEAGECVVMSFFTEQRACAAAARTLFQCIAGEPRLHPYRQQSHLRLEDFQVKMLHPESGPLVLSPCARLSRLTFRSFGDVDALDGLFEEVTRWRLSADAHSPTGFIGAQRFVDTANHQYVHVSFWSNDETLHASTCGEAGSYYEQYVSMVKAYAKEGTELVGRYFHQQFLHAGLYGDLGRVEREIGVALDRPQKNKRCDV